MIVVCSLIKIDFHIYAPAHLIRPELISIEAGDELLKAHFRYALQRPVLFESILALSYSNLAIMPRTKAESDAPFMYHYGQAINHIRRALAAGYIGDAVLFAIISLLAINYLRNDLTAFQSNLQGLRQIITLRGGLNALGWPALLKPGILTVESFWTYLSNQAHLLDHCTVPAILTNDSLPSPEAGVECITPNLPTGFRILAEQGRLNRIVLEIVQREVIFEASLSRTPPSYFAYHDGIRKFTHLKARDGNEITVASNLQTCEELARLIVSPDLMPLDIICCIGMLINSLCVTRNEQLSPIFFTQLQYHAKQLIAVDLDDNDVAARDLKTWTIFNIASTMVSESSTYSFDKHHNDMRLALAVKVVKHFSKKSWEDVQSILQQFICSESCIDAFKNVWDFGSQYMGQQIRKLPASG